MPKQVRRTEFTLRHALWANICSIATAYDLTPEEAKVHILSEYSDPKDREKWRKRIDRRLEKIFRYLREKMSGYPVFHQSSTN